MTELNDKEIMDLRLALYNLHAELVELPVSSVLWTFVTIGRPILQWTLPNNRYIIQTSGLICTLFVEEGSHNTRCELRSQTEISIGFIRKGVQLLYKEIFSFNNRSMVKGKGNGESKICKHWLQTEQGTLS